MLIICEKIAWVKKMALYAPKGIEGLDPKSYGLIILFVVEIVDGV